MAVASTRRLLASGGVEPAKPHLRHCLSPTERFLLERTGTRLGHAEVDACAACHRLHSTAHLSARRGHVDGAAMGPQASSTYSVCYVWASSFLFSSFLLIPLATCTNFFRLRFIRHGHSGALPFTYMHVIRSLSMDVLRCSFL